LQADRHDCIISCMKTIRLRAHPTLSSRDLETAVSLLLGGQLVAIPTETVYGLAADLFQPAAIQKIFTTKGRPADNPLIAHISSMRQLERIAERPHPLLLKMAERFWPGPLTLIFERKETVPPIVSAHLPTIAVRMPSHPCARQLIHSIDSPLAAPSANLSGRPSPTSAADVLEDFDGAIPAIIDGGPCAFGIESTVIGMIDDQFVLLRPGAIDRAAIENEIKITLIDPPRRGPILSPGMKYRHYAPKAKIRLVDSADRESSSATDGSVYVLEDLGAQNLYSHLRNADRLGYSEIVICLNDSIRQSEALMNRLQRACGEVHG